MYHLFIRNIRQDSYDVMRESYETAKLNYEVISERERVGKASEYDKLSAEVVDKVLESRGGAVGSSSGS